MMTEEEKKLAILNNEIITLKTAVKATLLENVKKEVLRDYPQATMKDLEMYRVSREDEAEDWCKGIEETGGLRDVAEVTEGLKRRKEELERELALMKQGILTKDTVYMRVFMCDTEEEMRDWLDSKYDVAHGESDFRKMVARLFASDTSYGKAVYGGTWHNGKKHGEKKYDEVALAKLSDEVVETICKEHPEWAKDYYDEKHDREDIRYEISTVINSYDERFKEIMVSAD